MEWDVDKYIEHSKLQFQIGSLAIERLSPQPGEHVLDIGCGIGNLSAKIAEKLGTGKIIGIDVDNNMIQASLQRVAINHIKNFEVIQRSAVDIDYENEFDAIFSNIVLHWIRNVSQVFNNMYRALKVGGRISIATIFAEPQVKIEVTSKEQLLNKDRVQITDIEFGYLRYFIEKGYYKDILTLDEFMAYQKQIDKNIVYDVKPITDFQKMLINAKFQDIIIEKETFVNSFDDIEIYLNYRQSNIWTYFLSFFPKIYRGSIANRLKDLIRKEWNEFPLEKKEWPIKEIWLVLFIQARKK
jgi:ubiquinone/menaquinone biosynthesis C-methylase UbiE